jgi:hypothetical protein
MLIGKVVDPTGRPVAQADLRVLRQDTLLGIRHTLSSEDGSFIIPGLPLETVDVLVQAAEYRVGKLSLSFRKHGERREVKVRLTPGQAIEGRVVDRTGEPVEAARMGSSDTSGKVVSSGPDGTFRLGGLADSPLNIFVVAPGFATSHVQGIKPGTRNLEVVVDRPATVSGAVTIPPGVPHVDIAACRYEEAFKRELCLARVIVRHPATEYELKGLGPGDYEIVGRAEGHPEQRAPVRVTAGKAHSGPTVSW